jgi:hypothetical protein
VDRLRATLGRRCSTPSVASERVFAPLAGLTECCAALNIWLRLQETMIFMRVWITD